MALDDEVQRGQLAESLRNNPLLQEIFLALRDSYITDWSQTERSDVDKREQQYYLLKALDDIELELQSIISTGRLATQQIESNKKK
jgi:hypothetical protein